VQAYIEERAERGERGSFSRESFAKEVLQPLAGVLPELQQETPTPEPETSKPWLDPVTGQYAKNPYAKDSLDLTSQGELEKRDPALASHLKAVASGVSYSFLSKLHDEREARQRLRELPYSEKEHLSNPFLLDKKTGLKPQSQFVKEHEPYVVTFYQREAATTAALPFQAGHRNMTKVMQCHKLSPQIAAVMTRAEKLYNEHGAAELQRFEEAAKSAEAELQRVRERTAKS